MMKINIGTKNKSKIDALKEILNEYSNFLNTEVIPIEVKTEISNQPKSLEETIDGAMQRAKNCFYNCYLSVGLESGLMKTPKTKTGFMDTTACAIYDGENFHLGLSSCFEYPIELTKYVLEGNTDISQAAKKLGITDKDNLGAEEGMIGILTKGRLDRKGLTKQAIRTALIHLENKEFY